MFFLYFWIGCIILTGYLAKEKNREIAVWVLLSLVFSPLVLLIIICLPKREAAVQKRYGTGDAASAYSLKAQLVDIKEQLTAIANKVSNLEVKINAQAKQEQQIKPEQAEPLQAPLEPLLIQKKPAAATSDIEINLGKFWLNKIGIIIFALGILFLLTYTFKYFGPFMKILFGFSVSAALFFAGTKLEKDEKSVNYGRVLLGGAWAITYFTTYAMYHFEASKIINSQILALCLLGLVALGIIIHSLRYKYEPLSAMALFIAFLGSTVGDISYVTLISSGILALIALVLVYKLQWIRVIFVGIVLTYLTHSLWVIKHIYYSRIPVGTLSVGKIYFLHNTGFLIIYWLLFTAGIHLIRRQVQEKTFSKLAAANFFNFILFFFMAYPKLIFFYPQYKLNFVLALGLLYIALALCMEAVRKSALFTSNVAIAITLLTYSVTVKFIPYHASIIWYLELPVLILLGLTLNRRVFRFLGIILALIVGLRYLLYDFPSKELLYIGGWNMMWSRFLAALGAGSSLACFCIMRFFKTKSTTDELGIGERHLFSFLFAGYLTVFLWQVVPIEWLTFILGVELLALYLAGYFLADRHFRWYALSLLLVSSFRFCFIDNYARFDLLIQWSLIVFQICVCYFMYYVHKKSKTASHMEGAELDWAKVIFVIATASLLSAIFRYIKMHWASVALGISGVALFLTGFISKEKIFRIGGFVLFGITVFRIVFVDLADMPLLYKIISFIILGILFLGVSLIYTRLAASLRNSSKD